MHKLRGGAGGPRRCRARRRCPGRWAGFNCSIAHKIAVIKHLDGLAESATPIGAVNCAVRRDGRYTGENADGQGFICALREVVDPSGKSIVLFGAGGAARAIAVEAALAGAASVTVVYRSRPSAEELVALINGKTKARAEYAAWDRPYRVPVGSGIVVNA
jgi:shikimate dehydrogenase